MNILGVDYGTKRVGLAWVQEGLDLVLPYGLLTVQNDEDCIEQITTLVWKEQIGKIVLGLPLALNGEEEEYGHHVRLFSEELEKKSGVPVDLIDERLSSKQADAMGGEASRDEKAAMVLLQSYLEQH